MKRTSNTTKHKSEFKGQEKVKKKERFSSQKVKNQSVKPGKKFLLESFSLEQKKKSYKENKFPVQPFFVWGLPKEKFLKFLEN